MFEIERKKTSAFQWKSKLDSLEADSSIFKNPKSKEAIEFKKLAACRSCNENAPKILMKTDITDIGFEDMMPDTKKVTTFNTNESTIGTVILDHVSQNYDIQTPLLLRGVDWLYSWLESSMAYAAVVIYEMQNIPTDLSDLENFLWAHDYKFSNYFFWCVMQDLCNRDGILRLPYLDDWFNYFGAAFKNVAYYAEHPEYKYVFNSVTNNFLVPYISTFRFLIAIETPSEGLIIIPFIVLDFIAKLGIAGLLILFMMYWYDTYINGNSIDSEFFINALSVEAEEEIASIEDTSVSLVVVFCVFGWFFFANYFNILTNIGDAMFMFLFIPVLFGIMFLIPIYLLIDYGMNFLIYLRGAGSTSSLFMEFVYDCIAFLAFFIRLGVQNVRLLLITLTFFSLYELILFYFDGESLATNCEQLTKLIETSSGLETSYYYLLYIAHKLLYWIYELLHTFFVVIAQFSAFFAMVFWLFLFLYTMFVVDEMEKYLDAKRAKYKNFK